MVRLELAKMFSFISSVMSKKLCIMHNLMKLGEVVVHIEYYSFMKINSLEVIFDEFIIGFVCYF